MRRRRTVLAIILALALVVVGGTALAFNPRVANHFGYALPGAAGLPSRVSYAGRDYAAAGQCLTSAQLQQKGWWPLHQVSQIFTVLGPAHRVYTDSYPQGLATTSLILLVDNGPCFAEYALEGGP